MSRTRLIAVGIDPDSSYTGMALAACNLPLGAAQAENLEVLRVTFTDVDGMDARRRLPEMAEQLRWGLMDLMVDLTDHSLPGAIVVEAQAHRRGDPRPDNIVQLAVVEGLAAGAAWTLCMQGQGEIVSELFFPLPVEWKGSTSKKKQHDLMLCRLGLERDLRGVCGAERLKDAHRSHVLDAVGLAVWGLDKLVFEERKRRVLS